MKAIFLLFASLIVSCETTDDIITTTTPSDVVVRAVFQYFTPDSVEFSSNFTCGWCSTKMVRSNDTFTYSVKNVSGNHLFSIKLWYASLQPAFMYSGWVNARNGSHYATIQINQTNIDYHYLIDNGFPGSHNSCELCGTTLIDSGANFSIKIVSAQEIDPGDPDPQHGFIGIDDNIPPEVFDAKYALQNPVNWCGYNRVHAWIQAIHDSRYYPGQSTVECQYIKLYARVNGTDSLIAEQYYNSGTFSDGGLYIRYPFFAVNYPLEPMPAAIQGNTLVFHPSDNTMRVWHWWTHDVPNFISNATSYRMEALIRITGGALVQGGIDWQTENNDHCQLGNGNWYNIHNVPEGQWFTLQFNSTQ